MSYDEIRPYPKQGLPKKKPKKPLPRRKVTGEGDLFKGIAIKRMPYSQISQMSIKNLGPVNFLHVLPKGKYPHFRLNETNIVLGTNREHELWDHYRYDIDFSIPGWAMMKQLEETLIELYTEKYGLVK